MNRQNLTSPSSIRILVIEDDPNTREYVKTLLQNRYNVEAVCDAVAARAAIEKQPPDLVLSNVILLPEHKSNPQNIKVPMILVCTALEAPIETPEEAVQDYLRKPFSERELFARVETQLKLAQMRQEAAEREIYLSEIQKKYIKLEERLQECRAQVEAGNQELNQFSYSISHDVRTPLRYINTFIDLLEKQINPATLDQTSREYLQIIADSAKQADSLLKDLLQFSRLGRAELRFTTIDMEQLVQEVLSAFQLDIQDRTINWQIEPLPEVEGDPAMLRVVLHNLISNAVKYTRTRQPAKITLGSIKQAQQIIFYIKDNGVGFDMQYVDKLFGIFSRLHLQEQFEGAGVGLANVRRIVHRHGGKTWAEGKLDVGATFYFSLPINQAKGDQ
ncbi:ATP-binding protein [Ancylothrix sp. C2]|uniref:hybrid sensor histidine kinase/response regulator n=1 Tax=Ancylothrix sp. D3o TaxID=2953691 RepID=UPI0021BB6B82|nr:ATP-binding protein [Ancylothrix sp. D3o]MCT7952354.1 ATP-binding protein [Ancylothrix sp. D3o]